ncbi:hypothetical protein MTO96_040287, partial [Rhipicephalus appendiculatus]
WLRTKIDSYKDPCKDFYSYVCGNHTGPSQLTQIAATLHQENMLFLMQLNVPPAHQRSWEKAAGLLQTCVSFAKSDRTETSDLAAWMLSLDLDLDDEERLSKIQPFDMIVRCSLDLGVPAILSLELQEQAFYHEKRVMKLDFSQVEKEWLSDRLRRPDSINTNDYAKLLNMYGVEHSHDTELAANLDGYERELESIINKYPETELRFVAIDSIPAKFQRPYNAQDQWVKAFPKYTNNTYTAVDPVLCQEAAVNVLVDVVKSESLGEKGLRYLIAWSVYTQLVQYTVPDFLLDGKTAADACYAHVDKAMHLALTSPFLQKVVPAILEAVKKMVSDIRKGFRDILLESSWVTGHDRSVVLRKLDNMKTYVGSPGRRLDPYFVEGLYRSYPDVPPDRLFPTWIKALGLSSHYLWSDQTTWLYDEAEVNAYYETLLNTLVVPTAIISRPLYNYRVPEALNYGALGVIVGHEMMHAYDVAGIDYDENAKKWNWMSTAFTREYTKRALCLRRSHRAAERQKARQAVNDTVDSENLADFVGVRSAYKAFSALPQRKRTQTLVGTNISFERLFFIAHCVKWIPLNACSTRDQLPEDENEKRLAGRWINLCLFSLFVAGLGLVDTIPSLYVPKTSTLAVTLPLHGKNTSVTTTPEDRHNAPSSRPVKNECSTCPCRSLAQRIREKLDYSVDPCKDFYKFVCNTFRGTNEFIHARESLRLFTLLRLIVPYIPESNQLSWQKAAGMYHACLNFIASYEPEASVYSI